MKRKIEAFTEGEAVSRGPDVTHSERARVAFEKLLRSVEREGKTPYLFFDLDGTLIPWGTEFQSNPKTLEDYVAENHDLVDAFKHRIDLLTRRGFRVVISTGRPAHFAQKAVRYLFPPNSVETIVAENGSVFARREGGKSVTEAVASLPQYFNREQLASFQERCANLIAFCQTKLGGSMAREGKEVAIALIPAVDVLDDKGLDRFFESVMAEAEREGITSDIEIHLSQGAVDITPKGVTKARASREILGDSGVGVYFGDSSSDNEAMSNMPVNIAPGNAATSTKTQAQKARAGLVAERQDMGGVVDALSTIEAYMRLRGKNEARKRKTWYFSKFAVDHLSEMHFLKRGGVLGKGNESWRNISEHCLAEAVAADILAEALGADRGKVSTAAILHDWFKRREIEAMRELGGAKGYEATAGEDESLLREQGVPDEIVRLAHANVPDSADQTYLAQRALEERILHFADLITVNSEWLPFREKLLIAARQKSTVEFSESMRKRFGGKSILELQDELGADEEREFEMRIGLQAGELVDFLRRKLEERING